MPSEATSRGRGGDVDAQVDQIGDEGADHAATVVEDLAAKCVDAIGHLADVGATNWRNIDKEISGPVWQPRSLISR